MANVELENLEKIAKRHPDLKSLSNIAKLLGKSKQFFYGYKRQQGIGRNVIDELHKKLGINPRFIQYGEEPMLYEKDQPASNATKPDNLSEPSTIYNSEETVKIYDIPVHANIGSLASFADLSYSYQEIPIKIRNVDLKNIIGFRVLGSSMINMGIRPNTFIFVDITKNNPDQIVNGETVVVNLNGTLLVKIWHRTNGKVLLKSANEDVPDIAQEIDDKLQIIGTVLKEYWSAI